MLTVISLGRGVQSSTLALLVASAVVSVLALWQGVEVAMWVAGWLAEVLR